MRLDSAGQLPDNQLSNSGQDPIPEPADDGKREFTLAVTNAVPQDTYKLCGGTIGIITMNWGCEATLKGSQLNPDQNNERSAYKWPIEAINDFQGTMIYACVIGETEKKVSCNVTGIPQVEDTQLTIDWSKPSRMPVPATFSQIDESMNQIEQRMGQQRQQQSNNDNEEEEEDED